MTAERDSRYEDSNATSVGEAPHIQSPTQIHHMLRAHPFDVLVHCFMAEPDGDEMVALVERISHSRVVNWQKAALLFGMAQHSTDIRIQVNLAALTSQADISREESRDINLVATCGQRAFIKNRVEGLEWPFIDSWRNRHDR